MDKCEFLVDVMMISYLHEDFLDDAIGGVIDQKCDFKFRLLIFDDCSPDNSDSKIKSLLNHSNPNLTIEYTRNPINLGMIGNGLQGLKSLKAEYVAFCEGDDYWTDPYKLQKQVDFLEENSDYSLVFHKAMMGMDEHTISAVLPFQKFPIDKLFFNISDIIKYEGFMPTASVLFRRRNLNFDFINSDYMSGDIPIYVGILRDGSKLHFMSEIMSFYRRHDGNITIQHHGYSNHFCINRIFMWKQLNLSLDRKYENEINATIKFYHSKIKANISQWLFSKLEFLLKPISSLLTKVVVNRGLKKYK